MVTALSLRNRKGDWGQVVGAKSITREMCAENGHQQEGTARGHSKIGTARSQVG